MIKINVFGLKLFLRVAILVLACLLSGIVFLRSSWSFTQIILLFIIILCTIEIISFVSRTNRDVARLLEALKFEEYGTNFSAPKDKSNYRKLIDEMNVIKSEHAKRIRSSKQMIRTFDKVINELETGVVLYDENHSVILKSAALDQLLNISTKKGLTFLENAIPGFIQKVESASDHAHFSLKNSNYNNKLKSNLECKVMKFLVDSKKFTLLIFSAQKLENIDNEYETWINFSRVISHEILNGISPLISLTGTLQDKMDRIEGNEKLKATMQEALSIIIDRTASLQSNSERYRTLNKLPEPNKEYLSWGSILENAQTAFKEELKQSNIDFILNGTSWKNGIKADKFQMDQVFYNLILNSIYALKQAKQDKRFISVDINEDEYKFIITFSDNGIGIDRNNRANVFLPFYSTREEGSGIGLAVVKQILWKHDAQIFLSDSDQCTSFVIHFPKI